MKDYSILKQWNETYNGAAIYALVGSNGIRYIGQARKLQSRLNSHRIEFNKIYKKDNCISSENAKIIKAIKDGVTFTVEILIKLPPNKTTINYLRYYERYYLEQFGGYDNTYNKGYINMPRWDYAPFNEVLI